MNQNQKQRFGDAARTYWAKLTKEERSAEMRRRMKKRHKNQRKHVEYLPTRKDKRNGTPSAQSAARKHTAHVEYLYGKVETILEYYARSNGVPFAALAQGVSGLLHDQAHGQGMGPRDRV